MCIVLWINSRALSECHLALLTLEAMLPPIKFIIICELLDSKHKPFATKMSKKKHEHPPIVYENGLGPAACAELQIEVALWWKLPLTSRNLGKMVVTIW